MNFPSNTKIVKYKGQDYELKFPNTGEMIDIEGLKITLTNGKYGLMQSGYNKAMVDMIATLNIIGKEIVKKINIPISKMEAKDSKELLLLFVKEVEPWLIEWEEALNSDPDDIKNLDEEESEN